MCCDCDDNYDDPNFNDEEFAIPVKILAGKEKTIPEPLNATERDQIVYASTSTNLKVVRKLRKALEAFKAVPRVPRVHTHRIFGNGGVYGPFHQYNVIHDFEANVTVSIDSSALWTYSPYGLNDVMILSPTTLSDSVVTITEVL